MSGYIKHFEYGGKNIPFFIKDDNVWEKYEQIWDLIKKKLGIKFHSLPAYDKKFFKTKINDSHKQLQIKVMIANDTHKKIRNKYNGYKWLQIKEAGTK